MSELFDAAYSPLGPAYAMSTGLAVAEQRLGRWGFRYDHEELRSAVGETMGRMGIYESAPPPQVVEYLAEALALSSSIRGTLNSRELSSELGGFAEVREFLERLRRFIFNGFGE
jgi:hypothetical protein